MDVEVALDISCELQVGSESNSDDFLVLAVVHRKDGLVWPRPTAPPIAIVVEPETDVIDSV